MSVYPHFSHEIVTNFLFWILKTLVQKLPAALISPDLYVLFPHFEHLNFADDMRFSNALFLFKYFYNYCVLLHVTPLKIRTFVGTSMNEDKDLMREFANVELVVRKAEGILME